MKFNYPSNKDFIIHEFVVSNRYKAFIAYIDGMVDRAIINDFILRPLLKSDIGTNKASISQLDYIMQNLLETNQAVKITDANEIMYEILSGNTCLYIDGCNFYISCETKGFEKRGVEHLKQKE